jgi:PAS domain S-box-containing protein
MMYLCIKEEIYIYMDLIAFKYEPFIILYIAILAFSGCYTSLQLFNQTGGGHKYPNMKKWFSPILLGITIWSIQFLSMIRNENQLYYNLLYFFIGLAVAAAGSYLAYYVLQTSTRKFSAVIGSASIFTLTMKLVHVLAVYSISNVLLDIEWSKVFLAVLIPYLFSIAAFYFLYSGMKASSFILKSTCSLGLAILLMNYLCLESIHLWANRGVEVPAFVISERVTVILVSLATFLLIGSGFIIQMVSNQRMKRSQDIKQIRLNSLFHQNPYAIYALDSRGRVTNCNPAGEKITGYAPEELINKSYHSFVPKKYHKETLRHFLSTLRGNTIEFQTSIISGRNDELTIKVKSFPIVYLEKIIGVYAIIQDITENVHLKRQLTEKENHFRLVSEFSRELILLMDSDGMTKFVSPSHFNTLGYQEEELQNHNALSLIHPEDRSRAEKIFGNVKDRRSSSNVIFRYKKKSGKYIYLESSVVPIIENGEQYYLVTSREITERIELEEKLTYLAYHVPYTHSEQGLFHIKAGKENLRMLQWKRSVFSHDFGL